MRVFNGMPGVAMPSGLVQSKQAFFNRAMGTQFEVHAAGDVTEIDLYDVIGYWGVDAKTLRSRLRAADDVVIRIDSPGGDVFDGIAMYNDLVEHKGSVTVKVVGLAASAASLIAMAADPGKLQVADSAFLMIHNAWTVTAGDRHEFAHSSNVLGEIDSALNGVYRHRSGKSAIEISELMDAESWYSGQSAQEAGFADSVFEPDEGAQARYDLSSFKNAPAELAAIRAESVGTTTRDMERALTRDAGLSRSQARAVLAKGTVGMQDAASTQATRDAGQQEMQPFVNLLEELKR